MVAGCWSRDVVRSAGVSGSVVRLLQSWRKSLNSELDCTESAVFMGQATPSFQSVIHVWGSWRLSWINHSDDGNNDL